MEFPLLNYNYILNDVNAQKPKHPFNGRGKLKYTRLIWSSENGPYIRAKHGPIGMEKRLINAKKAASLENQNGI